MTLPGTPGVILGRNRRVAWGCTNVHDDSADLYVEEFDPRDPDHYRTAERLGARRRSAQRADPRARRRALARPGARSSTRSRRTRHGPLVEIRGRLVRAALDGAARTRWSCPPSRACNARAELGRVPRRAAPLPRARRRTSSTRTWTGHIALVLGRAACPSAARGDGSRPYAGRDPRTATGSASCRSRSCRTSSIRPRAASSPPTTASWAPTIPYKVTRGGVGPWRAAALFEALEAREGWTADDMARLQGERLSHPASRPRARAAARRRRRHPRRRAPGATSRGRWRAGTAAWSRTAAPAAMACATFRALGDARHRPARRGAAACASASRRRAAAIHRLVLRAAGGLGAGGRRRLGRRAAAAPGATRVERDRGDARAPTARAGRWGA